MADIRFESDTDFDVRRLQQKSRFDLIGMVVRTGFAKNRQQASYVLLGVAVVAAIIAFVFWPSGRGDAPPPPNPDAAFQSSL
jgi:hypothetical protein